jgi:hypothetical protein
MLDSIKEGEMFMPFYNTTFDPKTFLDKLKAKVSDSRKKIFDTAQADTNPSAIIRCRHAQFLAAKVLHVARSPH